MAPRKSSKRRQRQHGVLPAGFQWREGRPRWLPSPTRRAQGWGICDFVTRSARGEPAWADKGEAIARAEAINAAVAAWTLKGTPVPADMAAFAPAGAVDGSALTPTQRADRRAIGALIDDWLASTRFTLPRGQGGLAPTTAADYRSKIHVLQQALVEGEDPAALAGLRALPIETLAVPEEEDEDFPLQEAYDWLLANRGHQMAHGVMSVASVFFVWCWKKKRIRALSANPVDLIDRTPPAGRIRIGTPAELSAIVASAEALGHHSIGDAVLLALDLGWSLKDVLALDWRRMARLPDETGTERWHVTRVNRAKTGVASSEIPLLAIGEARVNRIVARNAAATVTPTHLVVREASPRNRSGIWTNRAFNDAWRAVRAHAADPATPWAAPSLLTGDGVEGSDFNGPFDFMDTRDTFIFLAHDADMSPAEVCKRSLHKDHARVHAVWAKHYGTGGRAVGRSGARKMGAHMAASGWVAALT
jgi:hypothetical protein